MKLIATLIIFLLTDNIVAQNSNIVPGGTLPPGTIFGGGKTPDPILISGTAEASGSLGDTLKITGKLLVYDFANTINGNYPLNWIYEIKNATTECTVLQTGNGVEMGRYLSSGFLIVDLRNLPDSAAFNFCAYVQAGGGSRLLPESVIIHNDSDWEKFIKRFNELHTTTSIIVIKTLFFRVFPR